MALFLIITMMIFLFFMGFTIKAAPKKPAKLLSNLILKMRKDAGSQI